MNTLKHLQKINRVKGEVSNALKTKSKRLLNRRRNGKKETFDHWSLLYREYRSYPNRRFQTPVPIEISDPPLLTIFVNNLEERYNCGDDHPLRDILNCKVSGRIKLGDRLSIENIFKNVLLLQDDIPFKAIRMNSYNDDGIRPLQLTFEQEEDAYTVLEAYEKVYNNCSTVRDSQNLPHVRFYAEENLILYLHNLKPMLKERNSEERRKADKKKILNYFKSSLKLKRREMPFNATRICKTVEKIRPLKLTFKRVGDKQAVLNAWNNNWTKNAKW